MSSTETYTNSTPLKSDNPSFTLNAPLDLSYTSPPVPSLPSPHHVLVAVKYTGICGSDVHYWTHGSIGKFVLTSPMVLGHESSGVVVRTGEAVTSLTPGDRVALEPGVPCRRCRRCKEGMYNLCADMQFAATPPHHGTLCRYYTLPEDFANKLPDSVSLEEGALIEPLAVAVHVVRLAQVTVGDTVVVYGAGPVGLLCMAVAKAYGAARVVAVDVNEARVRFAQDYAATDSFAPAAGQSAQQGAESMVARLGLGDGDGADIAIDASGAEACVQAGVHALRSGGRYVQAGMGKPEVAFPLMAAMAKELDIKVSFRYKEGDYRMAIGLVARGQVDVRKLISGKVKFEEAERAFGETKAARGIKMLIQGPE